MGQSPVCSRQCAHRARRVCACVGVTRRNGAQWLFASGGIYSARILAVHAGNRLGAFFLRAREPDRQRPFRVPLYPVTPIIFCATSAYLLWSSIAYTGFAALFGVALLIVGAVLALVLKPQAHEQFLRDE